MSGIPSLPSSSGVHIQRYTIYYNRQKSNIKRILLIMKASIDVRFSSVVEWRWWRGVRGCSSAGRNKNFVSILHFCFIKQFVCIVLLRVDNIFTRISQRSRIFQEKKFPVIFVVLWMQTNVFASGHFINNATKQYIPT